MPIPTYMHFKTDFSILKTCNIFQKRMMEKWIASMCHERSTLVHSWGFMRLWSNNTSLWTSAFDQNQDVKSWSRITFQTLHPKVSSKSLQVYLQPHS